MVAARGRGNGKREEKRGGKEERGGEGRGGEGRTGSWERVEGDFFTISRPQ